MWDTTITLAELRRMAQAFAVERDWRQFHARKNLLRALLRQPPLGGGSIARTQGIQELGEAGRCY